MGKIMAAVVLVLSGCGPAPLPGAPVPGSSCVASSPECVTASSVGYCEAGRWAEYWCAVDCSNARAGRCDWSLSAAGDACPSANEGTGVCVTSSMMLICSGGKMVAKNCATSCSKLAGGYACN